MREPGRAGELQTDPWSGGPLDGSDKTPPPLQDGPDEPTGIAVDETHVYWANEGTGTIMKLPK